MGCDNSKNTQNPTPKAATYPVWQDSCKSLLRKYLTPEVFEQLKDKKDKYGYTLQEMINSGVQNQDSSIGVYAGSEDSYTVFAPLMDKIIEEYHQFKPSQMHVSNWDVNQLTFQPLDDKYCISTRIRVARNLSEFPLGTKVTKEQRKQIEEKAKAAFNSFEGDLKGKYYDLNTMNEADRKQLVEDHFLFKQGDRFLEACGLNRDWPDGRGIFHNDAKTFLVWVNEEDQLRIISMQKGGDIKAVFERLQRAQSQIEKIAKLAHNEHLGYITTCPTNCGTGLRASIHVRVPHLANHKERMEKIAKENNVQIRGTDGEHSESKEPVFDISNKRRLGFSEVELTFDMYNGVKAMIDAEKELENEQNNNNFD